MKALRMRVFGVLDFFVGDGVSREIVDVFIGRLNSFDGGPALGADRNLQNAGMSEIGADASADAVRQTALGANVVEQARRETAAEGFVEHRDGVIVGIVAGGAERDHVDVALVYVVLGDEVIAGLGGRVLDLVLRNRRTFGPGVECGAQPGFHGGGIEVAADAENDVVGMNVVAVPVDQVLASDGGDGCVFGHAGVGIVGAVSQFDGFAVGNFADVVVAAGNAVAFFLLREVDFVGAEFGILQHVDECLEDVVEVGLQAREADGGRVGSAAGFYLGGADFEEVVELVAGLSLGAAGAPDLTVNIHQTGFAGGFVDRSAADAGGAVDQRQFVIFLQKDHHAVLEFDALGLLRLESGQRRDRNLLPGRGLRRGVRNGCEDRGGDQQHRQNEESASLRTSLIGAAGRGLTSAGSAASR